VSIRFWTWTLAHPKQHLRDLPLLCCSGDFGNLEGNELLDSCFARGDSSGIRNEPGLHGHGHLAYPYSLILQRLLPASPEAAYQPSLWNRTRWARSAKATLPKFQRTLEGFRASGRANREHFNLDRIKYRPRLVRSARGGIIRYDHLDSSSLLDSGRELQRARFVSSSTLAQTAMV
jgi:hypothetical protein